MVLLYLMFQCMQNQIENIHYDYCLRAADRGEHRCYIFPTVIMSVSSRATELKMKDFVAGRLT